MRRAAVTGTGAAATIALASLVMICAFIAVAVPRASLGYRTQVLQRMLRAASSSQTAVLADAEITGFGGSYLNAQQLTAAGGQLRAGLRGDRLPLAPAADTWSGMASGSNPFSVAGAPPVTTTATPRMELVYRSGIAGSARLTAGALPASAVMHGGTWTFQVAVTPATAARLGLHVGSRILAGGQVLDVTGIIRPAGVASSFWTVDPVAAAPQLTYPTADSAPYYSCGAFIGPAELSALPAYLPAQPLHGTWSFPLKLGQVNADQAAGLQEHLQAASYLPAASLVGSGLIANAGPSATIAVTLGSGLATSLQPFVATDDAVQRVLSLLLVSLAVIAAVVVLLGTRLVAEHRRAEFTMMRARGASLRQVAAVALQGGAAAVLPAAAAGTGGGVLATPGPASWLSWWLAGLIVAAALASPPLLAVWWHRTPRTRGRAAAGGAAGSRRRAAAARRWVSDAALACGAIASLLLLRQQGLPPPGRLDLFTSAAPVLAAIPVALLVMRAYPLVLGWLARLSARRRGVVMIVGFARGSAAARASVLPSFALVLAFAVVSFAATARGAITSADVAASWQAAGADAVVTAPAAGPGIPAAAQRLITGVPGVQRAAEVAVTTGTSGLGLSLPVIVVDPRQYAALIAATPGPAFPAAALAPGAAGPVPALIPPAAQAIVGTGGALTVSGRQLRIRKAGTVASMAGAPPGGQFVVLPRWALGSQAPVATVMSITGPRLDTAQLVRTARRAVPGATTTLRSQLLAAITHAPLPHGGFVTFAQGIAAAAAFSLLILMLTLILGARSRELTLARLTTMGLGPAQSRRIAAAEILPVILAATAGGTACALALAPLIGPAVDLAAFAGAAVSAPLRADAVAILVAAAGLLLLTGLALTIATSWSRSRGTTQALRAGE